MEFFTIASSSSGNASLVREEGAALLIDAGISARRIAQSLAALGMTPDELDAVLVTHAHSDHIAGIATLTKKYAVPVYASRAAAPFLSCAGPVLRVFDAPCTMELGPFTVRSFSTSHDAAGSVDYRIDCASGSLGLLTDTGFVTESAASLLPGVDTLLLEANHDVELLRSGPYPYHLKRRILSDLGHLSNDAAADFALECVRRGTRDILLAHLSAENNTPELAEYAVARRLQAAGLPVRLSVAPRDRLSEAHVVMRDALCEAK
ncbi:MAG: MBL fold metallo-hydrolase [Oscillospiraceae bacterium]|nr:MBL fold metallo-hydrolase [Oscillospiraceae bacterium]